MRLVDIVMPDDYPVCTASLDRVLKTAEAGRNAYAPAPVWLALQAFSGPVFGGRHPSPDELDYMAMEAVGAGAKGIFYFLYGSASEPCYGVGDAMRELKQLYPTGKQLLRRNLDGIKQDAERLWTRIREIDMNLALIGDLVLPSTPVALAASDRKQVRVHTLVSPSAIVLLAINTNYSYERYAAFPIKDTSVAKGPAVFHALGKTGIEVRIPPWFQPQELIEVADGNTRRRPLVCHQGIARLDLDDLKVSRIYVLTTDSNPPGQTPKPRTWLDRRPL